MIEIDIPGYGSLKLAHVVLDFNGTLALEGQLLPGVALRLHNLARVAQVHVITGDTFGTARAQLASMPCQVHLLGEGPEDEGKLALIRSLGPESVAAVGNGRNDRLMLREARVGIAVIGEEGASAEALSSAKVVTFGIGPALDLLLKPIRLRAALRT